MERRNDPPSPTPESLSHSLCQLQQWLDQTACCQHPVMGASGTGVLPLHNACIASGLSSSSANEQVNSLAAGLRDQLEL